MEAKQTKQKKKMGRPKKFADRDGSPMLTTRLDPTVYDRIKNHPEGTRHYIERLVTEDAERTGEVLGGAGRSNDAPGQFLVDGTEVAGQVTGDGPKFVNISSKKIKMDADRDLDVSALDQMETFRKFEFPMESAFEPIVEASKLKPGDL